MARLPGLALAVALALQPTPAPGDGGVVRLREVRGALEVTLFTTPEPLRAGPADLSVLVQERSSGRPLLDGRVVLRIEAPAGSGLAPIEVEATAGGATNRLLRAAAVRLPEAGAWRARVRVERGGDTVEASCALPVGEAPTGLAARWPWLAAPLALLALLAARQWFSASPRAGGAA